MRPTQQNVQGGLYLLLRKARSSLLCLKASPSSKSGCLEAQEKSILFCGLFQTQAFCGTFWCQDALQRAEGVAWDDLGELKQQGSKQGLRQIQLAASAGGPRGHG